MVSNFLFMFFLHHTYTYFLYNVNTLLRQNNILDFSALIAIVKLVYSPFLGMKAFQTFFFT